MWRHSHATASGASPTTTSSSSSYPSSSSSSSIAVPHIRKRKTMEELWQDISLATLCHETRPTPPASGMRPYFRSMILQDFLAGAYKTPHAAAAVAAAAVAASGKQPLSPTALSLSWGPDGPSAFPNFPCQVAAASAPPLSFSPEQRLFDKAPSCLAGVDRRHKRMMKNRESASRSRARKQAYTNELELEVAHLAEENVKLKQLNEELRMAMAAQVPRKKVLQRTASAPILGINLDGS